MTARSCGSLMIPESKEANGQGCSVSVNSAVLMYYQAPTVAPASRRQGHRAQARNNVRQPFPAVIPYLTTTTSIAINNLIHLISPLLLSSSQCFHNQSDSYVAPFSIDEAIKAISD
jgi:hypothetical protein